MSLNARSIPRPTSSNTNRPDPLEPGTYPARLVGVVVLGEQDQGEFKGTPKPPAIELRLTYELLDEFLTDRETGEIDETKPRWLSESLPYHNLSQDLAKSTKRYFALDPSEDHAGDWGKLIGTPCMVTVVIETWKDKKTGEDRFKEAINGVSAMRAKEASKAPELVNPPLVFDFYDPDMDQWDRLPEWLQDRARNANDFVGSDLQAALKTHRPKPKPQRDAQKPVQADSDVSGDQVADEEEEAVEAPAKPARGKRTVKVTDDADW